MAETTKSQRVNAASGKLALIVAALILLKIANGYANCALTVTLAFADLATGIAMLVTCCISPLLALIFRRNLTTKKGRCCRGFIVALICLWLLGMAIGAGYNCYVNFASAIENVESGQVKTEAELSAQQEQATRIDPFNICSDNNAESIRAFFLADKAMFSWIHRGEAVFSAVLSIVWAVAAIYSVILLVQFLKALCKPDISDDDKATGDQLEDGSPIEQMDAKQGFFLPKFSHLEEPMEDTSPWKNEGIYGNAFMEDKSNVNETEALHGCKQLVSAMKANPGLRFELNAAPKRKRVRFDIDEEQATTAGADTKRCHEA